jgi:hypothetical protein
MEGFRPPQYAPGQSKELMSDPMSLMAMMFAIPAAQGMAGPGNFIPHLQPAQNLADQYLASQYQRDQMAAMGDASSRGNDAVASRLLGLRSLVTDAPVTQLNREQANTIAGIANNPITKAIAGQAIGPENLEALMFGQRGDPSALASATNRIGFFRRDTMGGRRMSGESMQEFSQNVHENLYGKDADVSEMHGFMASQSGQLMEELFQRGALPQAMGDMTPAERVRMLSSSQRDDATVARLAEQFGHRDMMARDEKYQQATSEERKLMLADQLDTYKGKIQTTFEEADRFTRGDPRAKSAQEIEQTEGYGTAARNVDSSRAAKVAKDYVGALDAIREIFGDSGQGDAPIAALMKALDQFSGGSVQQIGVDKAEKTMREMRVAAQSAGVGLERLGELSSQMTAQGQAMGLSAPVTMQATLQTVQAERAMRESGSFSNPKLFGSVNEARGQEVMRARMMRGEASGAAKAMGALTRAYEENPELYKGTELEAAVKAAQDPNSGYKYTYDGKEVNLAEMVGRGGPQALSQLASKSGMDQETFSSYFLDPGSQEYAQQNTGLAFAGQKYQLARDITRGFSGNVASRFRRDAVQALRPDDMTASQFERYNNDVSREFSSAMGRVIVEETGGMSQADRAAHIEKRHTEILAESFEKRGDDEQTAKRKAEEYSKAAFGDSEAKRREAFGAMSARANTVSKNLTGEEIVVNSQINNEKVAEKMQTVRVEDANRAERSKQAEKGAESNIVQRVGDTLEALGQDPTMSGAEAARRIVAPVGIQQMRDRYGPELASGLAAAEGMLQSGNTETQANAEKILAGIYDGTNANAVTGGARALADQVFGTADAPAPKEMQELMTRAASGDKEAMQQAQTRIAAQNGTSEEGQAKTQQATDMLRALNKAKDVDLYGAGYRPQTAAQVNAAKAAEAAKEAAAAVATTQQNSPPSSATPEGPTPVSPSLPPESQAAAVAQEAAAAAGTTQQSPPTPVPPSTPESRVAAAVAQDELRTVGADALPPSQVDEETINNRADQILGVRQQLTDKAPTEADVAQAKQIAGMLGNPIAQPIAESAGLVPSSQTLSPSDIAAVQEVGGDNGPMADAIGIGQRLATATAVAATMGAPRLARAAEAAEAAAVGGGIVKDTVDAASTTAGAGSAFETTVDATKFVTGTKAAQKVAPVAATKAGSWAGRAAPVAAKVGRVAALAAPVLGGLAGALQADEVNRGTLEATALGALTGDAKTGSAISGFVGIEEGSTADKSLGVLGAAANMASFGAVIGTMFGGPVGTAVGAGIGGLVGAGSELYKWATEDPAVHAKTAAAEETVAAVAASDPLPEQDTQKSVQQVASAQEAIKRTVESTPAVQSSGGRGGAGGGEMNINGTLSLRGLQEALIAASAQTPMDSPDGGAPVFNGNVAGAL